MHIQKKLVILAEESNCALFLISYFTNGSISKFAINWYSNSTVK